mgnify:CR=1 FL=1
MTELLTPAEIETITGSPQPAKQERFLSGLGLRVCRNGRNEVILAREAFIRWQLGEVIKADKAPRLRPIK